MDTVFPRGTVTAAPSVIDGEIHCPGVGDNTVGLVTVITALKVLNHLGIQTRHDLIFAGTVREEGLGNLGGIRRLIDTFRNSLDACITVDGFQYQDIVYKGSGIHTERERRTFRRARHLSAGASGCGGSCGSNRKASAAGHADHRRYQLSRRQRDCHPRHSGVG